MCMAPVLDYSWGRFVAYIAQPCPVSLTSIMIERLVSNLSCHRYDDAIVTTTEIGKLSIPRPPAWTARSFFFQVVA